MDIPDGWPEPFVEAVTVTLREMAGVVARARGLSDAAGELPDGVYAAESGRKPNRDAVAPVIWGWALSWALC